MLNNISKAKINGNGLYHGINEWLIETIGGINNQLVAL